MPYKRILILTILAMIAFAGNSLLCRMALKFTGIDAASFTSVRIISGALTLWLITAIMNGRCKVAGSWGSALALFAYAAAFSFAYIDLSAGTGALLLFGAVQVTMIGYGIWTGERLRLRQIVGFVLASGGVIGLLLPGASAPSFQGSVLMLVSGVAWGIYSLRGRGADNPASVTAGNFLRAVPFAVILSTTTFATVSFDATGVWYATLSGALASGAGYAIWYTALRGLKATSAATVQLSVPIIAALGGVLLIDEPVTIRLLLAGIATLGGIALVVVNRQGNKLSTTNR